MSLQFARCSRGVEWSRAAVETATNRLLHALVGFILLIIGHIVHEVSEAIVSPFTRSLLVFLRKYHGFGTTKIVNLVYLVGLHTVSTAQQ